jgi:hypothetical protein
VKLSLGLIGWLAAYAVVLAFVVGSVSYMRNVAIAVYGTPQAQTEWDTWREDVKELEKLPYPVKRRTPKSVEPPALVLMRDYFGICLAIAVVLSSVLFGTFMLLARGAANSGPARRKPK